MVFDTNKLVILNGRPAPLSDESLSVYTAADEDLEKFPVSTLNTAARDIIGSAKRNNEFLRNINQSVNNLQAVSVTEKDDDDDMW